MSAAAAVEAMEAVGAPGGLFSLRGRRAFVTGASGGIGLHLAGLCATAGAAVALAARRLDKVEAAASGLRARGHDAVAVQLDVTQSATILPAFDAATAALGGAPDILINNAAVLLLSRFVSQSEADIDATLDTNLRGALLVAQEAARRMAANRRGSIINIGSAGGLRAGAWTASYAAAKAGLMHLTQVMALELAGKGVRVNTLCPGNMDTEMLAPLQEMHAAMAARTPLGRIGRPDDLDGAVLLLASDAGRYMTGAVIVVDGGLTLSWM